MSGRQDQYGWHWSYMYRTVGLSEGHTAPSSKTLKFGRFGPRLRGMAAVLERAAGSTDLRSCACLGTILVAIGVPKKMPRKFGG